MPRGFCVDCGRYVTTTVRTRIAEHDVRGVKFDCYESLFHCDECDAEVYDPLYNDINASARETAYKKAKEKQNAEN